MRGTTNLVHAETEYEIFEALGLEYKPPTQRDCQIQVKGGANPAVLEFNGEGRGLAVALHPGGFEDAGQLRPFVFHHVEL